jgi:hypothetical protein
MMPARSQHRTFVETRRFVAGTLFGAGIVLFAFASADTDTAAEELLIAAASSVAIGALLLAWAMKRRTISSSSALPDAVGEPWSRPASSDTRARRAMQSSLASAQKQDDHDDMGPEPAQNIASTARADRVADGWSAIIADPHRGPVAQSVRAEDS